MNSPSKPSPCVGIRTCSDYSPFGVELDGRTVSGGYRFGYQNQEKDDEIKGYGNSYQMVTGRKQETLTFKGTKQLVKSCGASEYRAEDIATFVDCSISIVGLGTAALVKQSMSRVAPKIVGKATEGVIKSYDDFVKEAQRLYPNKAGKIELYHITPKYLGGSKNGAVVPLDASYHQVITNEFRSLWPYGNGISSAT